MWNGPAADEFLQQTYVDKWHHFWRCSGGDLVNDGVHQIDLARWVLGVDYPKTVHSAGGRFDAPERRKRPTRKRRSGQFPN